MVQSLQLNIKSSIFDRARQLTIDKDFIEFDDKDLISAPPAKFLKNDIIGLRHGVKWINGYQFIIGRIYCIDVRNKADEIIKIRFKSIYGIRKKELAEKYSKIINALYDNFIDNITRDYLKQFTDEKEFYIAGIRFNQTGIAFDEKSDIILWKDVGTKPYQSYYSIYSISNPNKYKLTEYLTEWNTWVLYSVSRQILKDKELWSE
jgi:hypothetical protein